MTSLDILLLLLHLSLLLFFFSYSNAPDLPQFIIEDISLHMTFMVNILFHEVNYSYIHRHTHTHTSYWLFVWLTVNENLCFHYLLLLWTHKLFFFDFLFHLSLLSWVSSVCFAVVGLYLVWFTIIFVIFCHSRHHTHAYFLLTTNHFFHHSVPQRSFINYVVERRQWFVGLVELGKFKVKYNL